MQKKKKLKLNNILHFPFFIEIMVKFTFTEGFSAKNLDKGVTPTRLMTRF